jgi:hypothetical protein
VRIGNPERTLWVDCEAVVDLSHRIPQVPWDIYEQLSLPGYGAIQFEDDSTTISLERGGDDVVHLSLASLSALNYELHRQNRRMRWSMPLLIGLWEA